MSDPIADILVGHCFMPPEHNNDPADLERAMAEQVAKQIRQQIGRELLERRRLLDEFVKDEFLHVRDIREVCQLEES